MSSDGPIAEFPARVIPGFHRNPLTGLLLPEAISRPTETWTRDEWKFHERVVRFYKAKGIRVFLQCTEPACQGKPMVRQRQPSGDITLTCEHLQRNLTRAF